MKKHFGLSAAAFSCLGFLACWTAAPLYIKVLSGALDSWVQNFLRYMAAFVFWFPFLLWTVRRDGLQKQIFLRALIPSAFNVATQSCYAAAFYYAQPGFVTLVTMTQVFWVVLFSMVLFPPERRLLRSGAFWAGVVLSAAGVCGVVIFHPTFSAHAELLGAVLAALMAIGWGCYTVSVKALLGQVDARLSFSIITIYTSLGLGAAAFLFGRPADCLHLNAIQWSHVLISSLCGIALGHVLYYSAIRRIGASIPTMFLLLRPFSVLVVSAFLFSERLTVLQWLCGCILIAGSLFFILAQRKTPEIKMPLPPGSLTPESVGRYPRQ